MEGYVKRMLMEKEDLTGKINRLSKFINGESGRNLTSQKLQLMKKQQAAMKEYLSILNQRIDIEKDEGRV